MRGTRDEFLDRLAEAIESVTTAHPPPSWTNADHTDLVRYGKVRWRIEHDYRELKTGLGLDHFEGRSWIGWHRQPNKALPGLVRRPALCHTLPQQF